MRSDHAGETGAVWIYKGILAFARDDDLIGFSARHRATEELHLQALSNILPVAKRTRLLPVWRVAGWLTGALPALFGPRAVHATIDAVESFVDEHYQEQIDRLRAQSIYPDILKLLEKCQLDEIEHRDEARELAGERPGLILRSWCWLVDTGSRGAVALSRRL
ncbi:MAG: demethoxyubiquinone hydroxylase family protein [Rhizobiales bacterium]|nr:demethoxyubiquinone hydroxylase family protein [Hyphomicrobiales bacterium]